MENELDIV